MIFKLTTTGGGDSDGGGGGGWLSWLQKANVPNMVMAVIYPLLNTISRRIILIKGILFGKLNKFQEILTTLWKVNIIPASLLIIIIKYSPVNTHIQLIVTFKLITSAM